MLRARRHRRVWRARKLLCGRFDGLEARPDLVGMPEHRATAGGSTNRQCCAEVPLAVVKPEEYTTSTQRRRAATGCSPQVRHRRRATRSAGTGLADVRLVEGLGGLAFTLHAGDRPGSTALQHRRIGHPCTTQVAVAELGGAGESIPALWWSGARSVVPAIDGAGAGDDSAPGARLRGRGLRRRGPRRLDARHAVASCRGAAAARGHYTMIRRSLWRGRVVAAPPCRRRMSCHGLVQVRGIGQLAGSRSVRKSTSPAVMMMRGPSQCIIDRGYRCPARLRCFHPSPPRSRLSTQRRHAASGSLPRRGSVRISPSGAPAVAPLLAPRDITPRRAATASGERPPSRGGAACMAGGKMRGWGDAMVMPRPESGVAIF